MVDLVDVQVEDVEPVVLRRGAEPDVASHPARTGERRVQHGEGGGGVAGTHEETMQVEHLLPALQLDRPPASFVPAGTLREARLRFERDYIAAVLQHHGWRMSAAAQTLGIQRPNLYRKARQLGIPLARIAE